MLSPFELYRDFMRGPSFNNDGNVVPPTRFRALEHIFWTYWTEGWCWMFGHTIQDASYADPEHGNMDVECVNCGRYWANPLY